MNTKSGFFFAFLLVFVTSALHADQFKEMVCKRVVGDEIKVTTLGKALNLYWKGNGCCELFPLLRALAPKAIPDHLLETYSYVEVRISWPLNKCVFSEEPLGHFTCNLKQSDSLVAKVEVDAKLSEWDNEVDSFSADLTRAKIGTVFSKSGKGRLNFFVDLVPVGSAKTVKLLSERFDLFLSEVDGFTSQPECTVDNVGVLYP